MSRALTASFLTLPFEIHQIIYDFTLVSDARDAAEPPSDLALLCPAWRVLIQRPLFCHMSLKHITLVNKLVTMMEVTPTIGEAILYIKFHYEDDGTAQPEGDDVEAWTKFVKERIVQQLCTLAQKVVLHMPNLRQIEFSGLWKLTGIRTRCGYIDIEGLDEAALGPAMPQVETLRLPAAGIMGGKLVLDSEFFGAIMKRYPGAKRMHLNRVDYQEHRRASVRHFGETCDLLERCVLGNDLVQNLQHFTMCFAISEPRYSTQRRVFTPNQSTREEGDRFSSVIRRLSKSLVSLNVYGNTILPTNPRISTEIFLPRPGEETTEPETWSRLESFKVGYDRIDAFGEPWFADDRSRGPGWYTPDSASDPDEEIEDVSVDLDTIYIEPEPAVVPKRRRHSFFRTRKEEEKLKEHPLTQLYRAAAEAMMRMPKIKRFYFQSNERQAVALSYRHSSGTYRALGYTEYQFPEEVLRPWRTRFGEDAMKNASSGDWW